MSIRGRVTFECDTKGCHAELPVLDADDADLTLSTGRLYPQAVFVASGWVLDDCGELHCEQCCDERREPERDDAYERAAARARNNDFAETGGKDWT